MEQSDRALSSIAPASEQAVRPLLGLLLGILAVSTASIFIRFAQRDGAPALIIAAYRLGFAALLLAPVALAGYRRELAQLTGREWRLALLSGLFLGGHFATWILSLAYTSVASSVVLVSASPLLVALASPLFLREALTWRTLSGVLVATAGGVIIGWGDFGLGEQQVLGDLLALAGAVAAAGYFLIGRRLRARLSLITYIFIVYSTAALAVIALSLLMRQPFGGYLPRTFLWFLLLALVPQLIGHSSFNWALRYTSATLATVPVLGEPVGSTLLAYIILGEGLTWWKLVGGGLILIGIAIVSWRE